ncbi:MAG TPA: hypothetical protein VJ778_04965 [Burkholderiales bacterium]|nr:hypothetical protein [Burkholderiales bacterium]
MKICVTRDSVGAADDVNYHVLAAAYAELATALVVGGLTPVRLLRRDGATSSER